MRTVNTSRRAVAIAFVGAALIGLTVAGFELARSVLDEKWDRTEEVLRQMEEYRKGTPSARAFIDPQTWRVTVGYATFGIEPTVNPPQPGEDLEAMRKVIRKLLDERRQKVLLSAKIVHIPVREGSVLDLERLCGEHLILTSTGTVTLSRERFSKRMTRPENLGCTVFITNGNIVGGRTITIPGTYDVFFEHPGAGLVLPPILERTAMFMAVPAIHVWIQSWWDSEEDGK